MILAITNEKQQRLVFPDRPKACEWIDNNHYQQLDFAVQGTSEFKYCVAIYTQGSNRFCGYVASTVANGAS